MFNFHSFINHKYLCGGFAILSILGLIRYISIKDNKLFYSKNKQQVEPPSPSPNPTPSGIEISLVTSDKNPETK